MLCRPTNVAAASCQALSPVLSHCGEGTSTVLPYLSSYAVGPGRGKHNPVSRRPRTAASSHSSPGPYTALDARRWLDGLRIGLAALTLSAATLPNACAAESVTILTCTNPVSGTSWQIKIDFARHTVDSNPARISGTRIVWHDTRDGGNYTLDRQSGDLTVIFASSTGGYFIHDRCGPHGAAAVRPNPGGPNPGGPNAGGLKQGGRGG